MDDGRWHHRVIAHRNKKPHHAGRDGVNSLCSLGDSNPGPTD